VNWKMKQTSCILGGQVIMYQIGLPIVVIIEKREESVNICTHTVLKPFSKQNTIDISKLKY